LHILGARGVTYKFAVVAVGTNGQLSPVQTANYEVPKSSSAKVVAVMRVSTKKSIGNAIRRFAAKYARAFRAGDSVLCQADAVGAKYLNLAKLRASQLCRTIQKGSPAIWTKYRAALTIKRTKFNRPRIRVSVIIVLRSLQTS
jgi:hypothetical protein